MKTPIKRAQRRYIASIIERLPVEQRQTQWNLVDNYRHMGESYATICANACAALTVHMDQQRHLVAA